MKKPQIRFRSFYAKLVIMFLFMGLIPFLLMGMLIYNVYSNTMYENILGKFFYDRSDYGKEYFGSYNRNCG